MILLSVNIVSVRGLFSEISIDSITSSDLAIASCSAWLFERLLYSLNFSCMCVGMYILIYNYLFTAFCITYCNTTCLARSYACVQFLHIFIVHLVPCCSSLI